MMQEVAQFHVEPVVQEPLADKLVHRLLGLIKAGNVKPGDRLPSERNLAEMYGVSRPAIREAVRALAVLGVLKVRHGGGIFVSQLEASDLLGPLTFFLTLDDMEVDALYDARKLIEGGICNRAATRATPSDIDELKALISLQTTLTDDAVQYREADSKFHDKLADIAGNPFLSRARESMNILGLEFRKVASETRSVIRTSIKDHGKIVAALEAGDAAGAELAMRRHMDNVLHSTKAAFPSWRNAK